MRDRFEIAPERTVVIEPITTVCDPVRGLTLIYLSDGAVRFKSITPVENSQWKRWIWRANNAK